MEDVKAEIGALRRWHEEMAILVGGLTADQLEAQSGASAWTVAAVLSHLGSGAEIMTATLARGKADPAGAQAVWDRWNALSPGEQAEKFVGSDRDLVEAAEAIPADLASTMLVDLGFLPAPVDLAFVLAMRLSEEALHRWDVQIALDPYATVVDYVVPAGLSLLPAFTPFFAKPDGITGRVAVELVDLAQTLALDLGPDGLSLHDDPAGASTRLRLSGEAFLRLSSGRLAPEHTPASVTVEGELSLDDLRAVFPGY